MKTKIIYTNYTNLIRDKKVNELMDRVGKDNLMALMKMSKTERKDVIKRIERITK